MSAPYNVENNHIELPTNYRRYQPWPCLSQFIRRSRMAHSMPSETWSAAMGSEQYWIVAKVLRGRETQGSGIGDANLAHGHVVRALHSVSSSPVYLPWQWFCVYEHLRWRSNSTPCTDIFLDSLVWDAEMDQARLRAWPGAASTSSRSVSAVVVPLPLERVEVHDGDNVYIYLI